MMLHEFDLWLGMFLLLGITGLYSQVRTSLAWVGFSPLIYVTLCAVPAFGLTHNDYGMQSAIVASIIWVLFVAMPMILLRRLGQQSSMLDLDGAQKTLAILRPFYWGKPYLFLRDTIAVQAAYALGETERAEAILDGWQSQEIPAPIQHQIDWQRISGHAISLDWDWLLERFRVMNETVKEPSPTWSVFAARAYSERAEFDRAGEALMHTGLEEGQVRGNSTEFTVLPYFALSGSIEKTRVILDNLRKNRSPAIKHIADYWLGRALLSAGSSAEANITFGNARDSVLKTCKGITREIWLRRIERQSASAPQALTPPAPEQADSIFRMYTQAKWISETLMPSGTSPVVTAVIVACLFIFLVTQAVIAFGSEEQLGVLKDVLAGGVLNTHAVMNGQYWRLLTYGLFHKDVVHIGANMLALYWFGRMTQTLYGTIGFIAIYIVAGIAGGLVHGLVDPSTFVIGASGSVLGCFGAAIAGLIKLGSYIPSRVRRRELGYLAAVAVVGLIVDRFMPNVAAWVHLGGIASGFALGMLLPVKRPPDELAL